MENSELNLLDEPLLKLVPASVWKRILNYLIDVIVFSIFVSFLLIVLAPVYPLASKIMKRQPMDLTDQLVVSFFYGLYMSVIEALLKGKSLGKLITGTRAVTADGYPVSASTAFVRGLIRLIPFPFDQVSAIPFFTTISYPWHDRWSGTFVVDEAKSTLPRE